MKKKQKKNKNKQKKKQNTKKKNGATPMAKIKSTMKTKTTMERTTAMWDILKKTNTRRATTIVTMEFLFVFRLYLISMLGLQRSLH